MKAEIKIPRGWRRVKCGKSKDGDRYLCAAFLACDLSWQEAGKGNQIDSRDIYIRKIKKAGKK